MQARFLGENHELKETTKGRIACVRYLSMEEQNEFEVYGKDGVAHSQGKELTDGAYIFVITMQDRFLAARDLVVGEFHHSSFVAGDRVLSAGFMVLRGGVIRVINGSSGHYLPQAEHIQYAVDWLTSHGISLNPLGVSYDHTLRIDDEDLAVVTKQVEAK
jgi:hypothetical protein